MFKTNLIHIASTARGNLGMATTRAAMLAAAGVWLLLAACSDSSIDEPAPTPPVPVGPEAEVQAGFYITVGDVAAPASSLQGRSAGRATPTDGPYDPGQGYENYIDIPGRDFRFLFFTDEASGRNSRYIATLQVNGIVPVSGTESSKTYHVLGSVPQRLLANNSFRVVALANWGEYPELSSSTTIDELCGHYNAIFGFNQSHTVVSEDNPIPLYGVKAYTGVTYNPYDYTDLGTIHLLRAYAKIDVRIDNPEGRWSISSAELTNCLTTGYKAPAGVYNQADYVHGMYDADYTASPNTPTGGNIRNLAFTRIAADSSAYRIYMPEFRNIASDAAGTPLTDDNRTRIRVRFSDRNTGWESYIHEQYIDFNYYQAPENHPELADRHFNVMRNYWYRFTIHKGDELSDISVALDVQPYASVELDPMFGLERDPIDGYIILKKTDLYGSEPTASFMYDDRFGEYYDFQKYRLICNYNEIITRLPDAEKKSLGLTGDIWLIKCANHHTDDIGDKTKASLLYNANTGVYYDFRGDALNLRYKHTSPGSSVTDTDMELVDIDRDFQFNNIVLSRGDNSVESSFYDFAHGNYKGAFNPDDSRTCNENMGTAEDKKPENDRLTNFYRAKTYRRTGGWIEIVPYWLVETMTIRICRLFYNVYTDRYYDRNGYCIQDDIYPDFEFNVDSEAKEITLRLDPITEKPILKYRRSDGKYYNGNNIEVPRPSELKRDPRLPWPPQALSGDPNLNFDADAEIN